MPGLGPCLPSLVKKKGAEFVTEQNLWDQYGCRHGVAELKREVVVSHVYLICYEYILS